MSSKPSSSFNLWLFSALGLAAVVGILQWGIEEHIWSAAPEIKATLRWTVLALSGVWTLRRNKLTAWIFWSMLVGMELGFDWPDVGSHLKVISSAFLKLVKSIIAPLLFGTLVVGIAGHSDMKQVGRMGWKALLYFEIVTTLALGVGLLAINISGAGFGFSAAGSSMVDVGKAPEPQKWDDIILHIFPENIAKSVAEGQILQVVIFSVLFGLALSQVKGTAKARVLGFAEGLSEVMFAFTGLVMKAAPLGVGAAMAYTTAVMGLGVMKPLFSLLVTLYAALVVFVLGVLLPIARLVGVPIHQFLQAITEPVSLAFATASSEAALPKAMERMEGMGVPRSVVSFVMPTGYSFNLDGTTLYLSLASVFVAQACGVNLSIGDQLLMCFTLMLTSKGVAGVRSASFVILMGTVSSFAYLGLRPEPAFALLAIDALMDMARTAINVVGNCLATYAVARWEKLI